MKLHKRSGKVSFLIYDDFECRRLPELVRRVKINLRNQQVDVFERVPGAAPEVLCFKHRYVSPDHPRLKTWLRSSRQLERAGVDPGRFWQDASVSAVGPIRSPAWPARAGAL